MRKYLLISTLSRHSKLTIKNVTTYITINRTYETFKFNILMYIIYCEMKMYIVIFFFIMIIIIRRNM